MTDYVMELERVPLHTIKPGDDVSIPTGFGNQHKRHTVTESAEILGYEWFIRSDTGFYLRTHKNNMVRRYVRKELPPNGN